MCLSENYKDTSVCVCFAFPKSCICVCESVCLSPRVLLCYRFISVIVITAVGANRVSSADEAEGGRLA